jgi:hypothetical protein
MRKESLIVEAPSDGFGEGKGGGRQAGYARPSTKSLNISYDLEGVNARNLCVWYVQVS